MQENRVQSLGREDPLKKGLTIHSSILAWRIPWTEKTGELQSMGLPRVRHDRVTNDMELPWWLSGKESTCQWKEMQKIQIRSLGQEDPHGEGMATHSSVLAGKSQGGTGGL